MRKRVETGSTSVAIAYLRVSTEDQRNGPEAQRAQIEAWARRDGVTVAAWFSDHGISGAAPLDERTGLLGALDALREHGAGVLVVAKRDRLARDVMAAAMLEHMAARVGARIVSAAGEGSGTDDPGDVLMRRMVDAFAEYERAIIRSRTKAALAAKKARGERMGKVAFGYSADATGKLVPDAHEQAVLAMATSLRAQGTKLRGIVAALASAGHTGRTGKPYALTQVAKMLAPRLAHAA